MRTAAAIKPASEDRSGKRKKRSKPKSSKRRRRDRSLSSALSYSSSSLSEDDSPVRRKRSQREQRKPAARSRSPKKRRDSKKVEKRKSRKARSRRGDSVSSASSGSSRSCSTCHGSSLDGSRSPPARRGRSKGRERGRRSSRKGSFERYRSRSCSACSEYSGRGGSWERYREKDGSRRLRSVVSKNVDKMDGSHENKYEEHAKIIEAYDDFQSSRSTQNPEAGRDREPQLQHALERKRKEEVIASKVNVKLAHDSVDDGGYVAHETVSRKDNFSKEDNVVADPLGSEADDLEVILRQKALENFRKYRLSANAKSVGDRIDETGQKGSSKNLGKTEETGQKGSSKNLGKTEETKESFHSLRIVATESERKSSGLIEAEKHKEVGCWQPDAKARDVANPLPRVLTLRSRVEKNGQSALVSSMHCDDNSDPVAHSVMSTPTPSEIEYPRTELRKEVGSSRKQFSEQALPLQDVQNGDAGNEHGTSIPLAGFNKANEPPLEVTAGMKLEAGNCNSSEPVLKAAMGSQYEKKTFSRMHDGETVQVSYKVYIPKKTPALARRQLQR